jgi:hypothetical protein
MKTPNTFQIGSTTYTTREYCRARGITDNARILKIQWRINTYLRNHTIQQTIEELDRLTLRQEGIRPWQGTKKERIIAQREKEARETATSKMITQQQNGETDTRAIDQRELLRQSEWMNNPPYALKTPPSRENLESMLGTEDPRLQNLEKIQEAKSELRNPSWRSTNAIENAITQYAEAIQTVKRLKKELAEAHSALDRWAETTTNLLHKETPSEREKRHTT